MEIYTNSSSRKAYLEVPVTPAGGTMTVVITATDGSEPYNVPTVTSEVDGRYSIVIPYRFVRNEGTLTITWSFSYIEDGITYDATEQTFVEVVSPILSLALLKSMFPADSTEEEIFAVERAVRHVIQAHTGQKFGYARKTIKVEGHGETALRLPERLVVLEGVSTLTANLNPLTAIIVSDGWYIKKGWSEEVTPIASTDLYFGGDDITNELPGEPGYEKSGHGHIIAAPGSTRASAWRDDYPFSITGWWGYKTVPGNVQEAARLLVNDYACGEAAYRDRYLNAIKAADWRLDFNARTWEATGNVRADQLLSEYVLLDWAVV